MKSVILVSLVLVLIVAAVMALKMGMGRKKSCYTSQGSEGQWTVYGSDSCGWTRKQLSDMDAKGISYDYVRCDGGQCPSAVTGFPTLQAPDGTYSVGYKEFS